MDFDAFERFAHALWEEIPAEYREGVDGLVVRREAEPHPEIPDVHTLGLCLTEPYPSSYAGPETTRSVVVLFHGSFQAVAADGSDFDWEGEVWETLTHELRHHLESLVEDETLEGLDYAMDETFRRDQGESFDPWYYQRGLPLAPGVYRVEYDVYLEVSWEERDRGQRSAQIEFEWDGSRWAVDFPEPTADLHFVWLPDLDAGGGAVQLALVRRRGWFDRLRRALKGASWAWAESEATPRRMGEAPGSPGARDGAPGGDGP
jgi:predicted Zn-dependent protease with MMP-like domain